MKDNDHEIGSRAESLIEFDKPPMRWLWGGFGFHNSEASMTPLMSEEFRDQRALKTFREISPSYSRVFAGYWDWTREAMDRFADYYDLTFRPAGTTLYVVPGRMPVITDGFEPASYCEAVATRLEYLVKERKCAKIRSRVSKGAGSIGKAMRYATPTAMLSWMAQTGPGRILTSRVNVWSSPKVVRSSLCTPQTSKASPRSSMTSTT